MKKILRIGCFFENLINQYQSEIWEGICTEAANYNVNLLCFPGRRINPVKDYESQSNILYRIAGEKNIDALLIITNTIGTNLTTAEIEQFCYSYKPLPIVSLGFIIPSLTSITIDNQNGLEKLLDHLIRKHRYKHFAVISGPASHQEALIRNKVIEAYLLKHHLTIDPDLLIDGDFNEETGYTVMMNLLKRQKKIEVVIADNDLMAIGAIHALQDQGINVPEDIAVVGFDNIPESRYLTPPLTTVHQPIFRMGQQAFHILNNLLNHQPVKNIVLSSELIIRQSCGCFNHQPVKNIAKKKHPQQKSIFTDLTLLQKKIINDCQSINLVSSDFPLSSDWQKNQLDLIKAYFNDLKNKYPKTFIKKLNKVSSLLINKNQDSSFLDNFILTIRKEVLANTDNSELIQKADNLWEQGRSLIYETGRRYQGFKMLQAEKWAVKLTQITNRLIISFDLNHLLKVIIESFQQLEIKQGYLMLYEPQKSGDFPQTSRLILAYQQNTKNLIDNNGILFPTEQLLPTEYKANKKIPPLIIQPLYLDNEALGFMILEIGANPLIYDILQKQISSALKGALLMQEIKRHAEKLEQQVIERTRELTRINLQLVRENEQRIKAEISLKESKNNLRTIIQAMPIPLIISRLSDGKILYANQPFCSFMKIIEDNINQYTINDFFSPSKSIHELFNKIGKNRMISNIELAINKLDNTSSWIIASFQPLIFQNEQSIITGFYDITERKRLEKEIAEVREKEQQRIGQDLHDDICQKLAGIAVMLSVLEEKLKNTRAEEAKMASYISELINNSIGQVKNIARGLYPVELEKGNLINILESFCQKIESQFRIKCHFSTTDKNIIYDDFVALHLYRITQEAVHNAIRHGNCNTVDIQLVKTDHQITLSITDDGCGIPETTEVHKGMGLRIMSYRANLLGGKITIKPLPGHGTNIYCVI